MENNTVNAVKLPTNSCCKELLTNSRIRHLWGVWLLVVGVLMGVVLFAYDLLDTSTKIFDTSFNVFKTFLIVGSSLLGLGLFENLKDFFRNRK